MSKLEKVFRQKNGKAFIPFLVCGDPSLDMTEKLVYAMEKAGADIIELGIPFSDPTVESPVIRGASVRALEKGVTTDKIFAMVERLRAHTEIPLVLKTYANVVYSYGVEKFARRAAEAGVDGMILPDVPYEEKGEFEGACQEAGVVLISMIAPTSQDRISRIAREAKGYLYCASPAETGEEAREEIAVAVQQAKLAAAVPCVVSSGIASPEQAARIGSISDGIIVGTAIVKLCGQYGGQAVPFVEEYVASMCNSIHQL